MSAILDAKGIYEPSAWQQRFHTTIANEVFGGGTSGPGKTTALRFDILAQVFSEHARCADRNHPHHIPWGASTAHALHLRRKESMLDQSMSYARRAYKAIDPGFKWADMTGTFSSGMKIQFGSCWEDDSHEGFLGTNFTHVAFDELTQFQDFQYEMICMRVGSSDPVLRNMLRIVAASNPQIRRQGARVDNPMWVRDRFVEPYSDGGKLLVRTVTRANGDVEEWTRIFLPAKLEDNPDPEFQRNREVNLATRPMSVQRAYRYGDWYGSPGAFFGEAWIPNRHVCAPFRVPLDWKHYRAMDWGYRTHGCVLWFALSPDNVLYVHRELYFRLMKEEKVAKAVIEIESDMGLVRNGKSLLTGPADTQLWEERGDTGPSKATAMARCGVRWVKANKKSRQRNAERLLNRIQDLKDDDSLPGIVVFSTCKQFLKHVPVIMPDEDNEEEPDTKYTEDHVIDTALYGTEYAERLGPAGKSPKQRRDAEDMDDVVEDEPVENNAYV